MSSHSFSAKAPDAWIEIPPDTDNACGGEDTLDPGTFVRLFGWHGQSYPRVAVVVSTYDGARYSTGDFYPSCISASLSHKLAEGQWWRQNSRVHGINIDFAPVILEMLGRAQQRFEEQNISIVKTEPPLWMLDNE